MIRPLFSFFGAKWRLAPRYPAPAHRTIVEPFAGSAGYACRYPDRHVVLVERDPRIAALWRYLVAVPSSEVSALPLIDSETDVAALPIPEEARTLIGFWCNKGTTHPCRRLTTSWAAKWPTQFWGPAIRSRVARDVTRIRHWQVIEGDWSEAPDVEATWFVDPPYVGRARQAKRRQGGAIESIPVGDRYRHGTKGIDFAELGRWCRTRRGLVIACEANGATWLDFRPFAVAKATGGARTTEEVAWISGDPQGVLAEGWR